MNLTYSAFVKIPLDSDFWNNLKNTLNFESEDGIPLNCIKLGYQNIIHEMGKENFFRGNKIIGHKRSLELIQEDKAHLYVDIGEISEAQLQHNNDDMLLLVEDIYAQTETDVYEEATDALKLLFKFTNDFEGNIIIKHKLNEENTRFIVYQNGIELHSIEGNESSSNDLYNEYKVEMLYPEIHNQMLFVSNLKKINDTLTSDNPFLSYLLTLTLQKGCKVSIEESDNNSRIQFTLEGMKMSEILSRLFRIDEIEDYNQKKEDLFGQYSELKSNNYDEYASFQINVLKEYRYKTILNFKELIESLNMKNYLVNVEQTQDNISIQLYDIAS